MKLSWRPDPTIPFDTRQSGTIKPLAMALRILRPRAMHLTLARLKQAPPPTPLRSRLSVANSSTGYWA